MLTLFSLAVLGFVLQYARAQTQAAKATCLSGFEWSFNSLGQSPCDVAAALAGVCIGTTFTLAPLGSGLIYLGPPATQANSCRCSSIYYSLLAACSVCQDANFLKWSAYKPNCSTVYVEVFPQPIPSNTKVPHYAYLDVVAEDSFDPAAAQNAGGVESTSVPSSTGSSSTGGTVSDTALPTSNGGKKSNAGAIAGGVVGGLVALAIIAGLVFWLLRRNRRPAAPPSAYDPVMASSGPMASQNPMSTGSSYPSTPAQKVYDPNDPSTYPTNLSGSAFNAYTPSPEPLQQQYPQHISPNFTGNSASNNFTPGRPQYTGAPEL